MRRSSAFPMLTYVLLLLSLMQTPVAKAATLDEGAALIDLYTQKEPYSGQGQNQSGDAYAPEERVILYACVTYNLSPLEKKFVTFEVKGPANNTFLFVTASTDSTGIATVNFTIPQIQESSGIIVFGFWNTIATVNVADRRIFDTLTFRVGWIIEITSLNTVRTDLQLATAFMKGTSLTAQMTLRSIALSSKNAAIVVGAIDQSRHPLGTATSSDFEVHPGEMSTVISLKIPESADLGNATLYVGAYTALPSSGGALYCPEVSTTFTVILFGDINEDGRVDIKDLALVGMAFGSYPGHLRWNPIADLNQDNKVNITDIALIATRYGRNDP